MADFCSKRISTVTGQVSLMPQAAVGKVVQHCKNILNPSPDYLGGVGSHQT